MLCMRVFQNRYNPTKEAVYGFQRVCRSPLTPSSSFGRLRSGPVRAILPNQHPRKSSSFSTITESRPIGDNRQQKSFSEESPTIYALSSAPGRSAIAIIRCSGSLCLDIYRAFCPGKAIPRPRYACVRSLFAPDASRNGGQILDSEALVIYFPAPRTATGEDVLEFHVHGGNAIVKAILSAIPTATVQHCAAKPSIRYAEPGEFTKRAFYNGRLDLTRAEALGDTLSAETEEQRNLAVRGMSNALHERYEAWRKLLIAARGELEALIDFSEDQHFDDSPAEFVESVSTQIVDLQSRIAASLRNAARGELLRNGIQIALLGPPNAGKSSLLNRIVGREAAIVSAEAGTTRDVVEVNVDIGGYFCRFGDLAGIRANSAPDGSSTIGQVEQEGIRRAQEKALSADVVIVVTPFEKIQGQVDGYSAFIDPNIVEMLKTKMKPHQKILHVLNKSDLLRGNNAPTAVNLAQGFEGILADSKSLFPVSCLLAKEEASASSLDQSGLQSFFDGLTRELKALTAAEDVVAPGQEMMAIKSRSFDESLGSTERQRRLLEQCNRHLAQFLADVHTSPTPFYKSKIEAAANDSAEIDVVLAAERLRAAAECLAKVTGRGDGGDVEEVLGVVFEKFCVGK